MLGTLRILVSKGRSRLFAAKSYHQGRWVQVEGPLLSRTCAVVKTKNKDDGFLSGCLDEYVVGIDGGMCCM